MQLVIQSFTPGLFVSLPRLNLNHHFILMRVIYLAFSDVNPSLSLNLHTSLLLLVISLYIFPPSLPLCILPFLQIHCGGTAADVGPSSSTLYCSGALIAGVSHKHTELLYLQLATPRFNTQLSNSKTAIAATVQLPPHHSLHPPQPS